MTLHLKRPLAIAAVMIGAVAAFGVPAQAASAATTAVVQHAAAPAFPAADAGAPVTTPTVGLPGTPSAAPAGLPAANGAVGPAAVRENLDADNAAPSGPTVGQTIKRIKLWQSLTCFGILVAAVPFARRFALRR